ncbi:hypothetical protein NHX12_014333, partial [Muraenolepis orangiensis]
MISVFFFGTHQIGQVLRVKVVPYVDGQSRYGGGVRIRGFTEGMWEIQNTPGVGITSKDRFSQSTPSEERFLCSSPSEGACPTEEPSSEGQASTTKPNRTCKWVEQAGSETETGSEKQHCAQPNQPIGTRQRKGGPSEMPHACLLGNVIEQQNLVESRGTLLDATLHRIHGDLRIALKSDSPDVSRCVSALDQLSMLYVTSRHVQKHTELVTTLRKMRYYRACQAVMDKATMLYCRFKNSFLLGEGEE